MSSGLGAGPGGASLRRLLPSRPDEAGGGDGGGELVADGLELGRVAVELGVHFRVAEALGVIPEASLAAFRAVSF